MEAPGAKPQQELAMSDQQTLDNSQNAPPTSDSESKDPEQKEVTVDPEQKEVTIDPEQKESKDPEQKEVTIELRKYILLLASLVATVTYAAAFSPPGDVWQDTAAGHIAGDPIMRDTHHKRYVAFFYCNATAFAASLVVVVLVLILASLDDKDNREKFSNNMIALRTLQAAMVVDLLSLMGAYAAGTCRDTFTTVYSAVLVGGVVLYLVFQMIVAPYFGDNPRLLLWLAEIPCFRAGGHAAGGVPEGQVEERQPLASSLATGNFNSSSGGVVPEVQVEEQHTVPDVAPASLATGELDSSSGGGVPEEHHPVQYDAPASPATESGDGVPESEADQKEERQKAKLGSFRNKVPVKAIVALASMSKKVDKTKEETKEQFRKILMLLATFAVSITYLAGLSTPGGFWDAAGAGHLPGDAILKYRHNTRLAVFFGANTLAFVASLLIIVVLLDAKPHHRLRRVFIFVALVSLIVAYNAGSCRQTDTTVYVGSLIAGVVVYILLLRMVASGIDAWQRRSRKPAIQVQQQAAEPAVEVQQQAAVAAAAEQPTEKEKAPAEQLTEKEKAAAAEQLTEKAKAAKRARSLVLLLATLAATITYQAGLDPPGGVWQDNSVNI